MNEEIIDHYRRGACISHLAEVYKKTIPEMEEILGGLVQKRLELEANIFDLDKVIENAVKAILTYSSDTFDSEGLVTEIQARKMLAFLINQHLFDLSGEAGEVIDGAEMGFAYDSLIDFEERIKQQKDKDRVLRS